MLAATGLLTEAQIGEAMASRANPGEPLVATLVKSAGVPEEKLLQELAKGLHLPFTRLADTEIEASARAKVPTKVVFQYNIMPMRADNGSLIIASNDQIGRAHV